jgi:hypothetical protein
MGQMNTPPVVNFKNEASARTFTDQEIEEKLASGAVGAENSSRSCGQAIFVDQASHASVFSDAVLLKIDRFG